MSELLKTAAQSSRKSLLRLIPQSLKLRVLGSELYHQRHARRLAATSKRLDVCAAQVAHVFHLSNFQNTYPLRDAVCMEIGGGWTASHAIIFYLLGASKIYVTDVSKLLDPSTLSIAINSSDISLIRDILSPFEDHSLLRKRLNKVTSVKNFSLAQLHEFGVEYSAPIDLAEHTFDTKVDFVFSNSVLEHVPVDDIIPLLGNLEKNLTDNGRMIHRIHLEDHNNFRETPFPFLGEPASKFTREVQTARGNRVRKSQWLRLLSQIPNLSVQTLYEWSREDKPLPGKIDASVNYENEADLRVSHLGFLCEKTSG